MPNARQLEVIRKGGRSWNSWIRGQSSQTWDLRDSDLTGIDLKFADLRHANLSRSNLDNVDLRWCDLTCANLASASLIGADLKWTNLRRTNFVQANLNQADISHARLESADLSNGNLVEARFSRSTLNRASLIQADLRGTQFFEADLRQTNLSKANLRSTDLTRSQMGGTVFADNDLRSVVGLRDVFHVSRSTIGIDTVYKSHGEIPDEFLRGMGLPEIFITYLPSLLERPIQFFSCFISYSHLDLSFARRIYSALQSRGIRCWLDEHQMLPGDKLYTEVDRGIRMWDKVLLCCSENSLSSWWVDNEIKIAFDKEQGLWRERGKEVLALIPLNLDNYLFSGKWKSGLATEVKARLAADFRGWDRNVESFNYQLERLAKALRTEGGKDHPPPSLL